MKSIPNAQGGAQQLETEIASILEAHHDFKYVIIALESTGFYGGHIANYLSTCELLAPFSTQVYYINPKEVANYKKSFNAIGRISIDPWRGSQYLALQRLTRHRLHITECIAREKTYMLNNIFLKFSEFAMLKTVKGLNPVEYQVLNSIAEFHNCVVLCYQIHFVQLHNFSNRFNTLSINSSYSSISLTLNYIINQY